MAIAEGNQLRGADLRRARRLADLSQRDVAIALGVTRQRVGNVEAMQTPPVRMAARYLRAVDTLVRGEHRE